MPKEPVSEDPSFRQINTKELTNSLQMNYSLLQNSRQPVYELQVLLLSEPHQLHCVHLIALFLFLIRSPAAFPGRSSFLVSCTAFPLELRLIWPLQQLFRAVRALVREERSL